ncbi:hypothetical protein WBG78_20290 [Chryseolinea sp. T2]|uniref:hypothetical protein n=1 Tax=Chryseolinea sp. T2 TaxID=3129255 RepID=UPI003078244D
MAKYKIEYLTEESFEYTGVGVFVSFKHSIGIEQHKLAIDNVLINGLEIESTSLEVGAEASVSVNKGLIDYLEIWSYSGEYPTQELADYTLRQSWTNGQGREIIVK